MEKIIFVFSTPEGGGVETCEILEKNGFKINYSPNSDLWRLFEFAKTTKTGMIGDGQQILKHVLFDSKDFSDNWGLLDTTMGKNFGYGFKMWVFLTINFPQSKFIFCHKPIERNIAEVAANERRWIPSFAGCLSNCEKNIRNQISQYEQFSDFYNDRTLLLNAVDEAKILEFINA
jgi:hypothetical protein